MSTNKEMMSTNEHHPIVGTGTLRLYAMHPGDPKGEPEYHTTLIANFFMADMARGFRKRGCRIQGCAGLGEGEKG
jgi:hypothetical protein